jgi:hypothetical protein
MKRWLANEEGVDNYTMERKRKKKKKKISERVEDRRKGICLFSNMYQNVTGHCSNSKSSPVTDVLSILNLSHSMVIVPLGRYQIYALPPHRQMQQMHQLLHTLIVYNLFSSTARLLMSSTDVETFSTADIEEYAKLLGLRLQYLNAFIRPIGILHLGSSMKCWSIVYHITDYIYHRVIFYVTGVLIALGWIRCVCVCL